MDGTDVDVVVIGSGLGGLATALAAKVLGLTPTVLEKEDCVGGGTAWSMGAVWVGANDVARAAGIFDSLAAVSSYMEVVAGREGVPERINAFIHNASPALNLFRANGIPFEIIREAGDHLYGQAPGSVPHGRTLETPAFDGHELGPWRQRLNTPRGSGWRLSLARTLAARDRDELQKLIQHAAAQDDLCCGVGLIAHFLHQLASRGIRIQTGTAALSLIKEGGRVIGVEAGNGQRFFGRRGIVIATGGYESNEALVAQFEGLPEHRSMFGEYIRGDGLKLGTAVGAGVARIHDSLMIMLGDHDPQVAGNSGFRTISNTELPNPHGIVVNRLGRRFGDESSFQKLAAALRDYDSSARCHVNLPCWLVFDQQYVDKFGYGGHPPGRVSDWALRAHDLPSLARRAGIDADGLVATAARFNAYADRGSDPEYGRGNTVWSLIKLRGQGRNPSLGTLAVAPFYAVRLHPSAMCSAGLRADEHARVQDWDGAVIPGLYAVGNAAVHSEYGIGYQAGHSLASAMTFGFLAAQHIHRENSGKRRTKMTTIYTATVTTVGGREGRAKSSDGHLDVALSMPKEFGGPGGPGTNPEQLFAAGYSACFESVLRLIARQQKKALNDAAVTAHVNVHPLPQGFGLSAQLEVRVTGVPKDEVEEMVKLAHTMCPYSNATRGNIDVKITVV
jgi:3-oxosteroid 1-dehydrogenase